jgi:protein gp37
MNKQLKTKNGVVIGRGIEWTDYTSNPISGCFHACQWAMPDGSVANCYAEDVANRLAQRAYPQGFEHHYWNPDEFKRWKRIPPGSRVFVGSMADVFGHWVPEDQIQETLKQAALYPAVTFQFLTKNPRRVCLFTDLIPRNCWIGASTPPNVMWNKPLSHEQRARWLMTTLNTLGAIRAKGVLTWMSAEPLTINAGRFIQAHAYKESSAPIDWLVVGAASNGRKIYAPDRLLTIDAVHYADQSGVNVFFKGNMRSLDWARENWREEFPQQGTVERR